MALENGQAMKIGSAAVRLGFGRRGPRFGVRLGFRMRPAAFNDAALVSFPLRGRRGDSMGETGETRIRAVRLRIISYLATESKSQRREWCRRPAARSTRARPV